MDTDKHFKHKKRALKKYWMDRMPARWQMQARSVDILLTCRYKNI
jgi:hypothetical protein